MLLEDELYVTPIDLESHARSQLVVFSCALLKPASVGAF